tara:strand:+ start:45 stop:1913 length:1869 start_codon:yes stop_codon:yes gene_type:complete
MAKPNSDPDETVKKKNKGASIVVWGLMGLLVLGLGGFGVTNFGGGATSIGSVGGRDIESGDYARALQQEINALSAQFNTQLTLQQAQSLGIDAQVRQQMIGAAALDNENDRIGLSAGDARVAKEITAMPAFSGAGGFDRNSYKSALDRNNLTESQFENRLRDDLARSLLQGAVSGGFAAPAQLTDTLYAYISERRSFSQLRLSEADLQTLPQDPTEDELKAYYDANIADFTAPEARRITYVSLVPEDIIGKTQVDEAALRKMYADRIDEYQQPERRLVERLVYIDEAAALADKARLDAGTRFEDLVAERGLKLADVDLGDISEADLEAAGPAVFALTEPGVVGPFESELGPALFRMNGILAAQNISFEEARADLTAELAADTARRAIDDQISDFDDRLAGGETLEDLAKATDMTLGTIDMTPQSKEGIAAYPAFRKAADAVKEGDFPEIVALDEGGIFALRLDAVIPPTPIPFDQARDDVDAAWRRSTLTRALTERAIAIKSEVEGGASLGAFGIVDVTGDIPRSSKLENAPADLVTQIFTMSPGQIRVVDEGDYVALIRLDAVTAGSGTGQDAEALKSAIAAQAQQALGQDAFQLFTGALVNSAGITLNNAAITAVHTQFR